MINITVSKQITEVCPEFKYTAILCKINNTPYSKDLWNEINLFIKDFVSSHSIKDINKRPAILATRKTYKALGKDPNRYRPSAEALCRRIVKDMPLYQIDTAVDLINLISIKTGYSIGGFDADKVEGDLTLGVGQKDEKFEAIGRGLLNIDGLPVYRDCVGGIGTPTSDEERTKITSETNRLLMIINGYSGENGMKETLDYSIEMLKTYLKADEITVLTNLLEYTKGITN